MFNTQLRHILATTFVAILLTTLSIAFTSTDVSSAPAMQEVSAAEVQGAIAPSEKFWLGLKPTYPGAKIRLVIQWDRYDAANSGLGFFVLDENGMQKVNNGSKAREVGLAAGNVIFNQPSTMLDAAFDAVGDAQYTVVVYNDSTVGASFTLSTENGLITDDSGEQVTDPNAAAVEAEDEAAEDAATEDDAATEATVAEAAPVATVAPTAVPTVAPTATPEAVAEEEDAASEEEDPDKISATTIDQSGVVRSLELKGDLTEQGAQHFLGLEPSNRDAVIELTLTFDPQDSSELSRRMNFWVVDENGFKQFLSGTEFSQVALAAGNKVFRGPSNMRKARFNATGTGLYTVIVYNNSRVSGSYTLRVDGGILIDEAGQTKPIKAISGVTVDDDEAATATDEETTEAEDAAESATADPATTTTAPSTAATTPAATAPAATTSAVVRPEKPGDTYVVQAGDTLALIALDIYGNLNAWESICAFNSLANCNAIEIGDVINLPTLEEIASLGSGTAATAPAATAPAAAEPEPEAEVEEDPVVEATAEETAGEAEETTETATAEEDAADDAPEIDVTETVSGTESVEETPAVETTTEITDTDTITGTGG